MTKGPSRREFPSFVSLSPGKSSSFPSWFIWSRIVCCRSMPLFWNSLWSLENHWMFPGILEFAPSLIWPMQSCHWWISYQTSSIVIFTFMEFVPVFFWWVLFLKDLLHSSVVLYSNFLQTLMLPWEISLEEFLCFWFSLLLLACLLKVAIIMEKSTFWQNVLVVQVLISCYRS